MDTPCNDCGHPSGQHYMDGGSCSMCDKCDFKKLSNRHPELSEPSWLEAMMTVASIWIEERRKRRRK
jgi:predicted metal-binding protein